ncbi:hypothetical protein HQ524_02815 [Candidatus Uhrbacteria bacterium]|nr:hypothetical protein [Candidatus Uhrbacteria bacterium]
MKHFVENWTKTLGMTDNSRFDRDLLIAQNVLWIESLEPGEQKFHFRRTKYKYPQPILKVPLYADHDVSRSGDIIAPSINKPRVGGLHKDIIKGEAKGTISIKRINKVSSRSTEHLMISYTQIAGNGRMLPEVGDKAILCIERKEMFSNHEISPLRYAHGRFCEV